MLFLWAVAGVLAALAAGLMLMRAAAAPGEAADPSALLYRRQISEIDELAERGLMAETERRGAQAEAARRLLAASDAKAEVWTAEPASRRWVLAAAVAAPALALAGYLLLGSPQMRDQPFAPRLAAWRNSDLSTLSAPEIAAVLRQATRERPTESEGFRLLGLAESASQNPVAAVQALRRAAALSPERLEVWQMLGEAEVVEAGGKVDADAQSAFRKVLELSPTDAGARFYLAQAKADAGETAAAEADLTALLREIPEGDARRPVVQGALAKLEGKPAAVGDPAQLQMIRGMVAGLAAKLEANPDNPEGWVRIVRAYAVLGDTEKRDAAYAAARARYVGKADILQQLDEAARAEPMR